jgi:hypothetical protein
MPNQQRTKFHPSSNFSETYPNNTSKCNVQLMLPLVLALLLLLLLLLRFPEWKNPLFGEQF